MQLALCGFLICGPLPALAVDAIVIEADEVRVGAVVARNVALRLDLWSDSRLRADVRAARLTLPEPVGALQNVRVACAEPVIAEPVFGCGRGEMSALGGPTGKVHARFSGELRTDSSTALFNASGVQIADATLTLRAQSSPAGWHAAGTATGATLANLRKFAAPWFKAPDDLTIDGKLAAEFAASGVGRALRSGTLQAKLAELNFSNEAGTAVAENVSGVLRAALTHGANGDAVEATLTSAAGQALAGPVLLDLAANPLTIETAGLMRDRVIEISRLSVTQPKLLRAAGTGRVDLRSETPQVSAKLDLQSLEFPAAYTSFLQIALASTDFGDLLMSGTVTGIVQITNNSAQRLTLNLADVDFADRKGKVRMSDVAGVVHWSPDADADVPVSSLQWAEGGAYGLSGGAAALKLRARGNGIELTAPARLPIFDGAVAIEQLVLRNLGTDQLEILFEAQVEPISMPLLCKAFGWPEFAGTLAGRIPNLTFRNNELTVGGDVEARVFGGTVVGSKFRLQDPFGRWPRMYADVRARDLDLAQVTNTFAIGSITGKLEADVLGLELFAWSPVAFNARLETPKGDRSSKRISAKAVGNLSNIGGGGGSVMQALQSGALKFFDDYSYNRLGLTCQLRDNVCVMSGVEPAGVGYYIVQGSGVPRIDIIGNSGRVDWRQLVTQVSTAINTRSEDVEVK
jgi:hypothetical protein